MNCCVQKETVVVAAGDEVSKQVAATLARMDINPMEVGIDLKAVYEDGSIYTSDVLAIDEEQTLADLQKAFSGAFNLSVNAAIPTTETISAILSLAHTRAVSVGVEGAILTSKTSEPILGLVNARMLAIASAIADVEGAIDDELAQKISASIIDIGLKSKRKDNSTVTAAKNKITVIESINIERTADNNIKAINIGITLYFTAFASLFYGFCKSHT